MLLLKVVAVVQLLSIKSAPSPSPNPSDNFQLDKGAADSLAQEERRVLQLPRCQNPPEFLPKPAKLNNQKQLTP
ncbi:hypothetical protein NDI37_18990 [Funiculus sociatus GB2-A5]|uniref:Uncharacterized protein n=1 Tax=Funiculus sociatus GB2-A5 TaxID=2933946 RepID=A0ABV0JSW5_9CYAN|nr:MULTISPECIES: hypothetical protein [unclassified Trichocoleus]MBD1906935.1 hypothetical protein [Trichocoleus sp. FACHB-832]MBD2063446.1 hypothetical protein [Trichocoleus sp. FACHB-6]